MDSFARSAPEERLAYIREAANRRDLTPIIVEKDLWVCWTLRRLAEHPELGPHLTFKGGTSLSKAYGIIERFSEDIDLTIARTAKFIRDTEPPMDAPSGAQRKARTKELVAAAERFVSEVALPGLHSSITAALGTTAGWDITIDGEEPQTLLFQYPRLIEYNRRVGGAAFNSSAFNATPFNDPGRVVAGYIRPQVKLEFGARGEPDPHEVREVRPYIADIFPDALPQPVTAFQTLAAERTFWEKATILHALHHLGKIKDRLSRHYYDLYMLVKAGVAERAIAMPELLAQVVRNKSLMWPDPKASYATAVYGSLKLVPTAEGIIELKRDYAAMAEMFMGEIPSFDAILGSISDLENSINAT